MVTVLPWLVAGPLAGDGALGFVRECRRNRLGLTEAVADDDERRGNMLEPHKVSVRLHDGGDLRDAADIRTLQPA